MPTARRRPFTTATRAQSRSTSDRLCEQSTSVRPSAASSRHRVAHRARGLRVQPAGGLVEEDDLRVVHQRADDGQLLPHALAEAAARLVLAAAQPEALQVAPRARPTPAVSSSSWSLMKKRRFSRAVSRS